MDAQSFKNVCTKVLDFLFFENAQINIIKSANFLFVIVLYCTKRKDAHRKIYEDP